MNRIPCLLAFLALLLPGIAVAQGGPPLVTDDPETPGDGRWEINVAAIANKTASRREIALPDADINYGWGDHIQLKVDVPWTVARDEGEKWRAGLGTASTGVKWRFVDEEESGFNLSTYPQYVSTWLASSRRRGVGPGGHQFFAPLEASANVGSFQLDGEVGRNFVQGGGPGEWIAGAIAAHACGRAGDCLLEVRETWAAGQVRTLVNLGLHWKVDESLVILAAAGHESGPAATDPQHALIYLGVQLLR